MTIKILNFKKFEKGFLYGFADIAVPLWGTNLIIRGCKIFTKEGKQWVNLPSREFQNDQGETKYAPLVAIEDDAIYKKFTAGLTEAWNEYVKTQNHDAPEPQGSFAEAGSSGVPF